MDSRSKNRGVPDCPRISVVTPSFNQGQFVARTVRSVLLQDYPNLEYIFMDGGSTDGTMTAVAPYLHRFAYWRSEPDAGQAAAVCEGLRRATGDIMGYLNSDDLLAPGALSEVSRYFQRHPTVDAVYSHRVYIDENDIVTGTWLLPPHSNYLVSRWDVLPQETCFWRRGLFERAGNVDPGWAFALDYDLFIRFMNAGKFARINGFLGAFRRHENSKTESPRYRTISRNEVKVVRKRHDIRIRLHDYPIGKLLVFLVHRLGALYVRLPGWPIFPFLGARGMDYDVVWGGRLRKGD
jgi:glycosyltransferase involved in cell wall biosynthesis